MSQGIEAARSLPPDYFLLTDADIVHGSGNLRELVSQCGPERYDLVSLMVRLHCRSLWEKLLIPAFVFFFFKLYPPRWVADPSRRTAGAAGGCMLIRAATLERIGGIDSIRGEIIDDCALALRVKSVVAALVALPPETSAAAAVTAASRRASSSIRYDFPTPDA